MGACAASMCQPGTKALWDRSGQGSPAVVSADPVVAARRTQTACPELTLACQTCCQAVPLTLQQPKTGTVMALGVSALPASMRAAADGAAQGAISCRVVVKEAEAFNVVGATKLLVLSRNGNV
mmetsp:Transcript_121097/g.368218  ORF Transcript_121097/g.368218 Transcript_121097/m.368218 type:complete len:123 (+) Transcript_121097:129-497(+)